MHNFIIFLLKTSLTYFIKIIDSSLLKRRISYAYTQEVRSLYAFIQEIRLFLLGVIAIWKNSSYLSIFMFFILIIIIVLL